MDCYIITRSQLNRLKKLLVYNKIDITMTEIDDIQTDQYIGNSNLTIEKTVNRLMKAIYEIE